MRRRKPRASSVVSIVLLIAIAVMLTIGFYIWTQRMMLDVTTDMSFREPAKIMLFAPTYEYNRDTGVFRVCVGVKNLGTADSNIAGQALDIRANGRSVTYLVGEGTVELPASGYAQVCFEGEPIPTGYYQLTMSMADGSVSTTSMRVIPYCRADADCPHVVSVEGNMIRLNDMYCNAGYCELNNSVEYRCDEENAVRCDTLELNGKTYYCELHGSDTLWLDAPMEFLDDLNDNDCDGTVELGCDSCKSCTHDLNDIAPEIAATGKDVVVVLTEDIAPDSSDLMSFDGYWCIGKACVLLYSATIPSEGGHIAFEGNNHSITLAGSYAIGTYDVRGSGFVDFNNLQVASGAICFDNSEARMHASHIDVEDGSCAYLDSYSQWYDVNYACASAHFNREACVIFSRSVQLTRVVVQYPEAIGLYTTGVQYALTDVNLVRTGTGHDFYLAPRFPTITGLFCSNGKEYLKVDIDGNVFTTSSHYCGYMIISFASDDYNVDLNGAIITGGGIAINGGDTVVVFGPGTISGAYTGILIGKDITKLIFDLSRGDINLCGNHVSMGNQSFARPICRNCGQGYYIYANSDEFSKFDCDSSCLRAC